uniref:EGF-like domain-containing protein n=1 Tax=Arion vulgaris TaxID=1028688 RepID=A0A0B6ZS31_9EUPU
MLGFLFCESEKQTTMNRNMAVASTIVLIVILGTAVSQQSCPSGSFGCKYRCNCESWSCDSTGECTGRTKCRDGWFGPSCQYADVAFDSTVRRNTTFGRQSTVNSGNCIGTINNIQSVSVTSNADYHFTWMRLTFNNGGFSADINVGFRRNNSYIDCLKLRVSTDGITYLDIFCNSEIFINEVVLTGTGIASLCFAQISGGRNIALYLEPTQSSVYLDYIANKAVDGKKSGNFDYCSCTNGGDFAPTWTLTFSKPHQIHRFVLYNRDRQQERLKGFIIHSYENENKLVFNYKDTIRSKQNLYQVTPESLLKNVLFVDILSQNEYFTICEAEIYGDVNCPAGKYGIDCKKQCNCAVIGEACFVSTGDCPSGCSPGFYGNGCNSICPDKFYDIDCKKKCSQNCLNEDCNKVNGTCISCVPGKQGDFCEKDCNPGSYGPKCQEPCSQNCGGNGNCDGQTGFCSECKPGYMGDTCAKNCSAYTFGSGCIFSCSTNCTNQTCRSDSGHCFGCITGYIGTFCEKVYSAPSESEDSTAVIIGLVVALTIIILVAVTVVLVWRKTHRKSGTSSRLQLEIQDNDDVQNVFAKSEKMKTAKDVPSKDEMETENMPREQYINFNQVQVSTAIPVKDLHMFLLSHKADYFKHQFEKVPNISPEATTYVANSNKTGKRTVTKTFVHMISHVSTL